MLLPDEFTDTFVGAEAVPAPGSLAPEAAPQPSPVPQTAPAETVDLHTTVPQPRQAPVMGAVATDLPPLQRPTLPELGESAPGGDPRDLRLLADVEVQLAVEIGRVTLPLRELLSLAPGAVLELDRAADAPVDVLVNGCLVARGEVVVIDGEFGVRITAVVER